MGFLEKMPFYSVSDDFAEFGVTNNTAAMKAAGRLGKLQVKHAQ